MDRPPQTALGTARARFVEGMPRRASELRAAVSELERAPTDERVREDMRRRLHALYATAQVFEADALALAVKIVIARLDAARATHSALDPGDLGALIELAEQLPTYVGGEKMPAAASGEGADATGAVPAPPQALEPPRPVELMQSVAGFVRAPPTFSVLVVHGPALQARVRELLPRERYEVTGTDDPEQAIRIVHDSAPDLAFVSGDLASQPDVDIVRRLQTDPLSNVRGTYVILPAGASYDAEFVRQTGADGVLVEPLDAASFLRLVESHERHGSSTAQRSHKRLSSMAEGTVAEIAGALAEEIRTGIAEALRAGRNERVQVEDPSALMAVAWSAIGKVRSHLAEQSRGRVRFRGELASEAPTFLDFASVPEAAQPDADDAAIAEVLAGRRVLIADDDPAVLWFFAGLFREAGARVFDAPNGQAALELARRKRPDVVVSDILMPKIDGFALCRELKRDAQLAHVPVILLSWKEDFLQRMRELDAGANGYLRKESGSRAILAGVADLLRPLSRLREQLRGDDEVRGRVEGLGIVPLIESIAAVRPNARLSVRDAWNLFEVDIREGNQLGVTRTAADGAFARGEGVLVQLMGVTSGRFTITSSSTPLRAAVSLDKALTQALHTLAALLDAVSDKRLVHVALVAFDDEVLASLLDSTPTPLAEVVARFRAGETTASQLLLEGAFTPGELEEYLRELARRGAIKGVWAGDGTDLVAVARQERDERPGLLRHSSLPPRGLLEQDDAAAVGGKEARARAQARVEGTAQTSATAPAAHVSSVAELQSALGQGAPAAASSASVDAKVEPAARAPAADATPPPSAAAPRPQSAPQPLRFFLTIAALGAIGYAAVSTLERPVAHTPHAPSVPAPAAPASSVAAPSPPPAAVAATVAVAVAPAAAAPEPAAGTDAERFGRVLPFIDRSRGVEVAPDQGLLVVDYDGPAPAPDLQIGDRDLGNAPLAVALTPGRHELVVRRGNSTGFRYLIVRTGETRVITLGVAGR